MKIDTRLQIFGVPDSLLDSAASLRSVSIQCWRPRTLHMDARRKCMCLTDAFHTEARHGKIKRHHGQWGILDKHCRPFLNIGCSHRTFPRQPTLTKILSRIEGDDQKLKTKDVEYLLPMLLDLLVNQFGVVGGTKSQVKLNQMIDILKRDHFVSFWG